MSESKALRMIAGFTFAASRGLTLAVAAQAEERFVGIGIQAALKQNVLTIIHVIPAQQPPRRIYPKDLSFRRLMELKPLESH